ncbi:MAG: DUF4132 domain-containing protein [Ruminococcus sp.]|nr:DUF4132 domain-containing protein [Ruminococcus sp.]
MLYNVGAMTFDELEKALTDIGFDEESIKNGMAYLNVENERDDSLLENVKTQEVPAQFRQNYRLRSNLTSAIRNKITRQRNEELNKRFILFFYKLLGTAMHDVIYYSDHFKSLADFEKKVKDAFSEKYGDDTEAVYLSIDVENRGYHGNFTVKEHSAETFLKAAEYALKSNQETAALCALVALDKTPIDTDKNSPVVQKAIEIIKKSIGNNVFVHSTYKIACGEAAYFSDEFRKIFTTEIKSYPEVVERLFILPIDQNRILNLMAENAEIVTSSSKYIQSIAKWAATGRYQENAKKHLALLAEKYTDNYVNVMKIAEGSAIAVMMYKILKETKPDSAPDEKEIKEIARRRIAGSIASLYSNGLQVKAYLMGEAPLESIFDDIVKEKPRYTQWGGENTYYPTYGADDFVRRCIVVLSPCLNGYNSPLTREIGFRFRGNETIFAEILFEEKLPAEYIMKVLFEMVDGSYYKDESMTKLIEGTKKYVTQIAPLDVSKEQVTTRQIYLMTIGAYPDKYKDKILELANDSSKTIKTILINILGEQKGWKMDIINFLKSKKAALRELAVSVIAKHGKENYKPELEEAFNAEKSEKLKVRIASLIDITYGDTTPEETITVDMVTELTKNNKNKKVAWLFKEPYKPVRLINGETASDKHLQALLLCYSANAGDINPARDTVADMLNKDDVEKFAVEVFGRWISSGAAAKDKWILYFCSIHGGNEMINNLIHYIKEWSDNMRGAIAAEAVNALALNGSSFALMNVDSMARKYKNKQVKGAAKNALWNAAEKLGITSEELADRIVPDMGFDEKMCRTFDYGKRQFNVYLTPDLEIEIFNGDKKVKSMPKPGANDDSEIAEKSYAEFKEMKKQMKTVVTNQKTRLEYVLMCDRKWTAENWEKLFVKNPIMHCFAIGLIWGVYEDGKLVSSFRYLDDGSFTTSDEDEFELSENASIGLVHPIELEKEELETWIEQLSDYEITQPFPQLSRQIFRMTDKEKNETDCMRFDGKSIMNYTLLSKMTKFGWYKGEAQDAGFFYEFYRSDISSVEKDKDGKNIYHGYYTELSFGGMYIGGYDVDQEEVDIDKLCFFTPSRGVINGSKLKMKDVNERYFSEVILQITQAVGTPEE